MACTGKKITLFILVYNVIREFREKLTISLYNTRDDSSLRNLEGAGEVYLNSSVDTVPRLMAG